MTATATRRRRRPAAKSYEIIQPTQHWRIVEGTYYRDCWVRFSDGRLQLRGIRDDLVPAVAA